MKIVFYLMAALLLAATARADPNRYSLRWISGANVDLQPLFDWWTLAAQTTNRPVDITEMDTDKLAVVSNLWLRLPARPLLDWFDVKASEDKIVVVGSMWRLDATIEPAPMMFRRQTIYLRNPPVKEIQDFKLARAAFEALQGAQGKDEAAEQLWESNIQAEAAAMLPTNSTPPTVPDKPPTAAEAGKLELNSIETASNLNRAHARTQARDRQLTSAESFLATFPNQRVYWLDHFALRTGESVDGIEVYDLGAAPGLTY